MKAESKAYCSGAGHEDNDTPFTVWAILRRGLHEVLKGESGEIERSCQVHGEGEVPEIERVGIVVRVYDLGSFAYWSHILDSDFNVRTLPAVPTPAQLTTPPRVAPVSFDHFTASFTATCISSTFVISVLKNLVRMLSILVGGVVLSRMAIWVEGEESRSCTVARPSPDELFQDKD